MKNKLKFSFYKDYVYLLISHHNQHNKINYKELVFKDKTNYLKKHTHTNIYTKLNSETY